jgi:hypothetical protein
MSRVTVAAGTIWPMAAVAVSADLGRASGPDQ